MFLNPINPLSHNLRTKMEVMRARLHALMHPKSSALDNLYIATVQKSGSQWVKSIFNDKRVKRHTGLIVYPQHHYDVNDFHMSFPEGTLVPGLYIGYQNYDLFIKKPERYRTIYIYRDPRDIVVSWYYSILKTHAPIMGINELRKRLSDMSEADGISYAIRFLSYKFSDIRSWVELSTDDDRVLIVKFEDLVADTKSILADMFSFCGIDFPDDVLVSVVNDYSKDRMRKKDLERRSDKSESHYRVIPSSHRDIFTKAHYKLFSEMTGDLLKTLGYE